MKLRWKLHVCGAYALAAMACAAALAGCAPGTALSVKFPVGDAERGRVAFTDLHCDSCHRLEGFPSVTGGANLVTLGGHTPTIESYGDIVTSIVNPSHRLARAYRERHGGESPMAAQYLNDVMTVQQLVDISAFLYTEYDDLPPSPLPYWQVYPSRDDPFDDRP